MAKKPAVNKSQAVRDYLQAHPKTANKEIAEALSKQGIKISPNHISNIKTKMKASKGKRKRRQRAATAMSAKGGVSVPEIKAAFSLLKQCGGIARAKEALEAAREIQKVL